MTTEIRILFVEDVPADAEKVNEALRKEGLRFRSQRVDTREAFLQELEQQPPDVILSDHGLPAFDGFAALSTAREKCPDVPFIFVTNALTREMEIEKLAPGIMDFVPKSHLEHLGPAIRRVLEESREWRRQKLTEEERARIVAKLLLLLKEYEPQEGYIPICSGCKKIRDKQNGWMSVDAFFKKRLDLKFTHSLCPDCIPQFFPQLPESGVR